MDILLFLFFRIPVRQNQNIQARLLVQGYALSKASIVRNTRISQDLYTNRINLCWAATPQNRGATMW